MFRRRVLRSLIRKRTIVNLKPAADGSQTSFNGILWDFDSDVVVLKSASVIIPGQATYEVPGMAVIERVNVDWMQVTEGP